MQRARVRTSTSPVRPRGSGAKVSGSTTRRATRPGTGRPRLRVVGCRASRTARARRVKKRKVSGPVSLCPQPCIQTGRRCLVASSRVRTVGGWTASKVLMNSRTSRNGPSGPSAADCQRA